MKRVKSGSTGSPVSVDLSPSVAERKSSGLRRSRPAKPDEAAVNPSPAKKKIGRPSAYREELADEICKKLSVGQSLASICREEGMPAQSVVYEWLLRHASFLEKYTRAREEQAETHADEIVKIADETPDTEPVFDKHGNLLAIKLDSAYVAWQKQRIEARKWTAAKLRPKKYGDRLNLAGDAESPIKVEAALEADNLLQAILTNAELKRQQ
jgi:hypothetical protein